LPVNQFHKNLPEYYDSMYLDGYTPEQIMEAHHRSTVNRPKEKARGVSSGESGGGRGRKAA
jgi:hypothetical protein